MKINNFRKSQNCLPLDYVYWVLVFIVWIQNGLGIDRHFPKAPVVGTVVSTEIRGGQYRFDSHKKLEEYFRYYLHTKEHGDVEVTKEQFNAHQKRYARSLWDSILIWSVGTIFYRYFRVLPRRRERRRLEIVDSNRNSTSQDS